MLALLLATVLSSTSSHPGRDWLIVQDAFTGPYRSSDGKFEGFLTKTRQADETESYFLHFEDNKIPGPGEIRDIIAMNGELRASKSRECDDPGCYSVNSETTVRKTSTAPEMTIEYDWHRYPEGNERARHGAGKRIARRLYVGEARYVTPDEPVASEGFKRMTWSAVKKGIPWISSDGTIKLAGRYEDAKIAVYKKVYDRGQLEALYVSTKTTIKFDTGLDYPAECTTLLVKRTKWVNEITRCTTDEFGDVRF
ncbi:MAG: hypothetical protein V4760_01320 [Bdellovibrionota bacterium]